MQVVVEVGGWEHECCGPAYERDAVVDLTCVALPARDDGTTRYAESHHDLEARPIERVRGRVDDLSIEHLDGTAEAIVRVPSGRALRGFEDDDDGHLEQPWTGVPVANDSFQFRLTLSR